VAGENTAPEQLYSAKTISIRLWSLTPRSVLNLCLSSLELSRSAAGRNLKVSFPSQGSFSSLIPQLRCNQQTGADSRFIECEEKRKTAHYRAKIPADASTPTCSARRNPRKAGPSALWHPHKLIQRSDETAG
jgi:hypothetical protein